MQSCIYHGTVAHQRFEPVTHRFSYKLYMLYLDLDELPGLVGRGKTISGSRFGLASFLRGDHLFDRERPLADEVRERVARQTGIACRGPIRLLTQLRYFGYYMSPLNLFYCLRECGTRVEAVVAEVNNTPWNERHCYLLWDGNREPEDSGMRFIHPKDFHVSPFMDMDLEYDWRLSPPDASLKVCLANRRAGKTLFTASMNLERRELSRSALRRMSLRFPVMTARISAAIYLQALRLWWKKCPFYAHPRRLNQPIPTKYSATTLPATVPNRGPRR
ncbi:MAG: DUF1365 domain-containing protein [Planctomycetes bacterium]|nr:DUF1365 domain-containing protein [Planctomycetota bacterium]